MRLNKKRVFAVLFIIILIVLMIAYLMNNKEDLSRLLKIKASYLWILIGLTLVQFVINGLSLKVLTKPFNVFLKFREWFGISVITTFGNYLTFFKGGSGAKAVYLKKYHHLNISSFIALIVGGFVVTLFVYAVLGIILTYVIFIKKGLIEIGILVFFIVLLVISLVIMFLNFKLPEFKNKYLSYLIKIINGWHILRKKYKILFYFSVLSIVMYLIEVLRIFYAFKALNYSVSLINSAFVALTSSLSLLVTITPAGLGIREAIIALTTKLIGAGVKSGVYMAVVDRGVTVILLIILGPLFSYLLLKRRN